MKFKLILKKLFNNFKKCKYKAEFVKEHPYKVNKATIYIINEGIKPDSIVFKCPCGCNSDIYLNLLEDVAPVWSFSIKGKKISIYPSVRRITGCKSHFFIKYSKVLEV